MSRKTPGLCTFLFCQPYFLSVRIRIGASSRNRASWHLSFQVPAYLRRNFPCEPSPPPQRSHHAVFGVFFHHTILGARAKPIASLTLRQRTHKQNQQRVSLSKDVAFCMILPLHSNITFHGARQIVVDSRK